MNLTIEENLDIFKGILSNDTESSIEIISLTEYKALAGDGYCLNDPDYSTVVHYADNKITMSRGTELTEGMVRRGFDSNELYAIEDNQEIFVLTP